MGSVTPSLRYDQPSAAPRGDLVAEIEPGLVAQAEQMAQTPTRFAALQQAILSPAQRAAPQSRPLDELFQDTPVIPEPEPQPQDAVCRLPVRYQEPAQAPAKLVDGGVSPQPVAAQFVASPTSAMSAFTALSPLQLDIEPISSQPVTTVGGEQVTETLLEYWQKLKPVTKEDWWKFVGGLAVGLLVSKFFLSGRSH